MDRLRRIHTALALLILLSTLDAVLSLREPDMADASPWFLGVTCALSLILVVASFKTVERMRAEQAATHRRHLRAAATDVTLERTPCNVAVLVNEAVKSHRASASEQGIRLRFDAPLGLTVSVDRPRIAHVLSSLLRAHIASASRGTLITVDTADVGDTVQLVLTADVVSVAESPAFRRPFPTPAEDVGLAVAERIVIAHGGEIQFEMTLSGMRVVVSLPKTSHYKDEMVAQGS